ncbi:hypothetical protein JSE7799_00063 [Jannaschia seosinensis]|uniref:Flp pilus assembly protein, pilin Flp n=1 Tax=Jannaschia seosinensis TaxID=313367 RepID=A0A0M7B5W9_9RHOB|nr:hypothetical protein [Jannaschia seosinensis]CUH08484.1 hypothetical protein JSE7799_00063 [Jannaschia seosinensis]
MLNNIRNFAAAEDGAVTVDWVVLTAALVGLGLAVMGVVSGGIEKLSGDISTSLENTKPTEKTWFDDTKQGGGNGNDGGGGNDG